MAKTIPLKELNKQYEFVCNEWVQKFCKKQGVNFDVFVSVPQFEKLMLTYKLKLNEKQKFKTCTE